MGKYINKGNKWFSSTLRSEYVDKSGLIRVVNDTLYTEFRYSCVTRCRRFGKSMAAKMLCAYYDRSCQSRELFAGLEIASDPTFEEHLNKYPVLYLDMTSFMTKDRNKDIVSQIDSAIRKDLSEAYPDVPMEEDDRLIDYLLTVNDRTGDMFVFIIYEWDAILREFEAEKEVIDKFVNWLRSMFKSSDGLTVFAGVYMTGILPIKKYKTESALNNFWEYSMVAPKNMASYFGFTVDEVKALAAKHGMDYNDLEKWYDGYQIGGVSKMFNPNSVMMALREGFCQSFWSSTGAFESVADYIRLNYKGLKDDVIALLSGAHIRVNTTKFQNDMSIVRNRDEVLTVLIHLGYLTFDRTCSQCYVPNMEVGEELRNAVEETDWNIVIDAIQQSERLLQQTLWMNTEAVACGLDAIHSQETSILSYNDENSLACVISLAYYYARNDYVIHRELPTGYGFADMVFIPRKNVDKPALIIEFKQGHSAEEAIRQIKERKYIEQVSQHTSDILLVGLNYDKESKQHTCIIEKG
ncbi:MAG: AAA family ATPase [Bacteroidaceae bacterium]|nr:AAA family ATPase [Bacteroidaceae bacterium]